MKRISLYVACVLATSSLAAALPSSAQTEGPVQLDGSKVPAALTGLADEAGLAEIACLEARWRAGELLARLEALGALLTGTEAELAKLDIDLDLPGYSEEVAAVKARLDNICAAVSLSEQQGEIDSLVAYAGNLKTDIPAGLKEKLDGRLRPALEKQGGELRAEYEAEFKAKGEALRKQAETDLKAQSEKAVKEKEAELKVRIEEEIGNRLGARIEAGEFGSPPDQGRIEAEAEALAGPEAEAKRSELEEALKAEYEALAKDKEAALRTELDKEALDIEKEKTAAYAKVAEDLGQLSAKVEALAQAKAKDWQVYQEQVKAKKGALIDKAIAAQVDEAARLIDAERARLDAGIAAGEKLKSADELAGDLKKAAAELAAALKSGELMPDQLDQAKDDFQAVWEKVKADLEKVKAASADQVLAKVADEVKNSQVIGQIDRYLAWGNEALASAERTGRACADPKRGFPYSTAAYERCRLCYKLSSNWEQPTFDLIRMLKPKLEAAKSVFAQALSAGNGAEADLAEALELKSRVESAAADMANYREEYRLWQAQDAEYRSRTEEYCRTNANKYIE